MSSILGSIRKGAYSPYHMAIKGGLRLSPFPPPRFAGREENAPRKAGNALNRNQRTGRTRQVRHAASENRWRRGGGRHNRRTPRKTASVPAAFSRTDRQSHASPPTLPAPRCPTP